MKDVHKALNYFGVMCVFMFSLGFIFRWVLRDVIALDQLLGLSIGIIILITVFFMKRYSSKESHNS
ncbi:TPA: hypothetical protein QCR55_000932 [Bacillus cereus]|uniref:hypothetical protein n=1 Tax=unclassified Bacillus (in: firmicutes) TaxID=185979 RepID=UPI002248A024|nr:hypothetical protein [Bacillus sp. AS_3]MCW4652352.1 hypothetical protein [Bacillus sp. AS_3]MCX2700011.1 hypothetical protein [Bacillus sp. AS_5]HDR4864600.1 hypothetical protein [Bacillus cereus]HDR4877703.1 hypothetical protein [Bacillus cereus]